jgi:protein-disulfide isomerase
MKRLFITLFTLMLAPGITHVVAHEMTLGPEKAPVTIIEYTSLTCHHCADFHLYTLPLIKQKYVNTGKLRLIIRPLPLDKDALMAFQLVQALPEAKRDDAMAKMYASQTHWIGKSAGVAGRMLGLTPEQCAAAVNNKQVENTLLAGAYKAQKEHKIDATPVFIIGDKKVEGALTMTEFDETFAEALNPGKAKEKSKVGTRLN